MHQQIEIAKGELRGMLMIDRGREDARVDLDRMMYQIPAEEEPKEKGDAA